MSRKNIGRLREKMSKPTLMLKNLIRRMTIEATVAISTWDLLGFIDGEDNEESDDEVEVFQGVGRVARPPAGVNAEVVVANVGAESNHPVVIADRDEDTRKANVTEVAEDETVEFNSRCRLHLKADGTIEARTHGGAAVALATKSDVDALAGHVDTHKHAGLLGGTGSALALTTTPQDPLSTADPSPAAVGTTKLKGE